MRRIRVIPTLLIENGGLVKTERFKAPKYIGDPINTVKILNEKEVDEIVLLDIGASKNFLEPNLNLISDIASEAFVPLAYGGGITSISQVKDIFSIGVEKIILNSAFYVQPNLIRQAADIYGSQSIVVSIDARRRRIFGGFQVFSLSGKKKQPFCPSEVALKAVEYGAGELLITSIDNEGLMDGYDIELIRRISELVSIPIIANGGAGVIEDFVSVINEGKATAVAAGSMFVFKGPHRAVLINYPEQKILSDKLYNRI